MTRLLLISDYALFGQGLESLLSEVPDVEIVGYAHDLETALPQVRQRQPDVVILGDGLTNEQTPVAVMRILDVAPATRVIGLNLADNTACTLYGTRRAISTVSDLVSLIAR